VWRSKVLRINSSEAFVLRIVKLWKVESGL
jgi:hypothetical protein